MILAYSIFDDYSNVRHFHLLLPCHKSYQSKIFENLKVYFVNIKFKLRLYKIKPNIKWIIKKNISSINWYESFDWERKSIQSGWSRCVSLIYESGFRRNKSGKRIFFKLNDRLVSFHFLSHRARIPLLESNLQCWLACDIF